MITGIIETAVLGRKVLKALKRKAMSYNLPVRQQYYL